MNTGQIESELTLAEPVPWQRQRAGQLTAAITIIAFLAPRQRSGAEET
jgi:hypothetical protein